MTGARSRCPCVRSIFLKKIGAWSHIAPGETAPLKSANVINGRRKAAIHFDAKTVGEDELGCFMSNHVIRRTLYQEHLVAR